MAIPTDLKLVAGDVISIQALVKFDADGPFSIYASLGDGYAAPVRVERASASLVSTVLRVGDEVRAVEAVELTDIGAVACEKVWPFGIVVAIDRDTVWVDWPLGGSLEPLGKLRRVRTRRQVEDLEPRHGETPLQAVELLPQTNDGPKVEAPPEASDWKDVF